MKHIKLLKDFINEANTNKLKQIYTDFFVKNVGKKAKFVTSSRGDTKYDLKIL